MALAGSGVAAPTAGGEFHPALRTCCCVCLNDSESGSPATSCGSVLPRTAPRSAGDDRAVRQRAVLAALLFVAGFSTVFVLLGATASAWRPISL